MLFLSERQEQGTLSSKTALLRSTPRLFLRGLQPTPCGPKMSLVKKQTGSGATKQLLVKRPAAT